MGSRSVRRLTTARVVAIVYLILLTWLLWVPRPLDAFGELAPGAEWLIGPGYWIHGALYCVLGLLLCRGFAGGMRARVAAVASLIGLHAVVSEAGQALVPSRQVDPFDLLSNLVGGGLGVGLWVVVRHRRASRASQ